MRLILATLMIGLAGCDYLPDDRICSTPAPFDPTELTGPNAKPVVAIAEECIHRWGYRLAGSTESVTTVAEAVVRFCDQQISTQIVRLAEVNRDFKRSESWVMERSRSLAAAYVVQARAGNCGVPK